MFDLLIFVYVFLFLPWLVLSVIYAAWRAIVSLCGDSPEDFQWESYYSNNSSPTINPASGLLMLNGSSGVDLAGNMYGSNSHNR